MKNIIEPAFMPRRATLESAGYDIYLNEDVVLTKGEYTQIDTGVVFEDDIMSSSYRYVGLIFPRSSYGFKFGLRFANSICVIDQDYRDTIKLSVTVDKDVKLVRGDRIAQLIFVPWMTYIGEIEPEEKRKGGIGSTGN